jgi:hypothetical protein
MVRVEKNTFISYRRADGSWALNIYQWLTQRGYDVFIDYEGIGSGSFETVIVENIHSRAHFLVLLSPTALERCDQPGDWLRREIEEAIASKRNLVPIMLPGFSFAAPETQAKLTYGLSHLSDYNGLEITLSSFSDRMERLSTRFLNTTLEAVNHPASVLAEQAARKQQAAANTVLLENVEIMRSRHETGELAAQLAEVSRKLAEFRCPVWFAVGREGVSLGAYRVYGSRD